MAFIANLFSILYSTLAFLFLSWIWWNITGPLLLDKVVTHCRGHSRGLFWIFFNTLQVYHAAAGSILVVVGRWAAHISTYSLERELRSYSITYGFFASLSTLLIYASTTPWVLISSIWNKVLKPFLKTPNLPKLRCNSRKLLWQSKSCMNNEKVFIDKQLGIWWILGILFALTR